jgi:bleomycin hydrolase
MSKRFVNISLAARLLFLACLGWLIGLPAGSQVPPLTSVLEIKNILPATPVKDQNRTSTCWSFSGISMIESELLRTDKGEYDLSEMFIVRHAYQEKAMKYVRMHGTINFSGGGAFNDVTDVIGSYGIVPEEVYPGLKIGEEKHIHAEMDAVLKSYVEDVIQNRNRKLTPVWFEGFCSLLDTYLGEVPREFEYGGKTYSPESFARSLGLGMDDYVLLTSFTHHPFYQPFIIEIPDNWSWQEVYNITLDELIGTIDHSLSSGYTVAWAADVSEGYFSRTTGIATVPPAEGEQEQIILDEQDGLVIETPVVEENITQELRQEAFNNYTTTDDHGMHIIGTAADKFGKEYYIVKNSWGDDSGPHAGYYYVSKAYVRYKTTDIMVHKASIPDDIREKINL